MSTTLHLRVNRFSHDVMSSFSLFFFLSFLNTSQSDPYQFVYTETTIIRISCLKTMVLFFCKINAQMDPLRVYINIRGVIVMYVYYTLIIYICCYILI